MGRSKDTGVSYYAVEKERVIKKSDEVRRLVADGDFKPALRIAKGFKIGITHEDSTLMARAYECMVHPEFYRQLGMDTDAEIGRGIETVKKYYGRRADYE